MEQLPKTIRLRPRFTRDIFLPKQLMLKKFEEAKRPSFIVTRVDDYVFIKFKQPERNFWSPQLQLEFIELAETECRLRGLFGPSPGVWTFFMFIHFGLAAFFVGLCIWAYTNWLLQKPYGYQIAFMFFVALAWTVLYVVGRIGKNAGREQMNQLYHFMESVLEA